MRPFANAIAWLAQPHSGWTSSSASGASCRPALDVGRADARVDVALAHPDPQLAPRDPLEPEPEVHVREEQDLAVGRDRLDHGPRVARGAAVVGLGLHLRGRVHVRDDDRAGMLGLPRAELVGRDRRGERAAGAQVGDQHRLARADDRRGLGHEVDAAEDDRRRRRSPRPAAREPERVADEVGRRPAPRAAGSCARGGRRSARGRARAPRRGACRCNGSSFDLQRDVERARRVGERADRDEVDAGLRVRADVLERDAAGGLEPSPGRRRARPRGRPRPGSCCRAGSDRHRPRAPPRPRRASRPRPRSAGRSASAATAGAIPPARRRWFSFTRIASSSPARWFVPPPQRTAYFSSARRPGVVLRVSRIVAPCRRRRRRSGASAWRSRRGGRGG